MVRYEREGMIGRIVLNRPEKRNSLNLRVWNSLGDAVSEAEKDTEARVILVKGEGKSFCAGLDLSPENEILKFVRQPVTAASKVEFFREVLHVQAIHTRLERLTRPTIAVVQAHCLGAGLELAVCCDIRLCDSQAQFALPEARLGIITDVGGLQRLPRIVGPAKAREIAYRARRFSAQEALAMGLVNEVFESVEELEKGADQMAAEIAANAPLAVQGAKEVFLHHEIESIDRSLEYNAARSSMVLPSEDMMEAFQAFLQKRDPVFKGK